jgi:hypothetical protein
VSTEQAIQAEPKRAAFYGDATSVRPLAFAATIKDMKGLLRNG